LPGSGRSMIARLARTTSAHPSVVTAPA
jgi:hypothetical protein